ncbi:MAG: hypothetical protein U0S36_10600 [Candidatus Nanopelagicales bacterium]
MSSLVLALNCGSSSVKLALLDPGTGARSAEGLAARVGTPEVSVRLVRGDDVVDLGAPDDVGHRERWRRSSGR